MKTGTLVNLTFPATLYTKNVLIQRLELEFFMSGSQSFTEDVSETRRWLVRWKGLPGPTKLL